MSPLEFGDLPPAQFGPSSEAWVEEAEKLRSHPRQWARITTRNSKSGASGMANHISNGRLRAFQPAGTFEATARGLDVWARYIGEVPA